MRSIVAFGTPANASSSARTFILGSSRNTDPMPVMTAQLCARNRCTWALDSEPVIHWLSPDSIAVLPSKLMAILLIT